MTVYYVPLNTVHGYADLPTVPWCACCNLSQQKRYNYFKQVTTLKKWLYVDNFKIGPQKKMSIYRHIKMAIYD